MLKVQEIREIIKLIDESSIDEFTYETNSSKIKLKKANNTAIASQAGHKEIVQEEVHVTNPQVTITPVDNNPSPAVTNLDEQKNEANNVDEANVHNIVSPMVGTFYRASSPENDPYVVVGAEVSNNTVVCIVEAMKLFNEIEAEVSGEIIEILVEDGELVEYGQPLFKVKTK